MSSVCKPYITTIITLHGHKIDLYLLMSTIQMIGEELAVIVEQNCCLTPRCE